MTGGAAVMAGSWHLRDHGSASDFALAHADGTRLSKLECALM
jgi:hypothetical protein